jgi:hypothetical protein
MKFALGFVAGLGAAWAALAIWQRVPPLGPIDPDDEGYDHRFSPPRRIVPSSELIPDKGGRPGYRDSVAGGSLADVMPIGARRIPPVIHRSDCLGRVGGSCTCGVL